MDPPLVMCSCLEIMSLEYHVDNLLTLPQSTPDYSFINVNIYIFHWILSVYIFTVFFISI